MKKDVDGKNPVWFLVKKGIGYSRTSNLTTLFPLWTLVEINVKHTFPHNCFSEVKRF